MKIQSKINANENVKSKHNRFYMWWYDPTNRKRDFAGIAYYNEDYGDYRLVFNFFSNNSYFLKCVKAENETNHYRLVATHQNKNGQTVAKFGQGTGFLDKVSNEIIIEAAPFSKLVILSLTQSVESKKEQSV